MAKKAEIMNVTIHDDGSVTVSYDTGTMRPYKGLSNLPKTAHNWLLAHNDPEPVRYSAASKSSNTAWIDLNGSDVELTEDELTWFESLVSRCKAATGCTCDIIPYNHEKYVGISSEALGCCITDNDLDPLNGNSHITIDTYYIHECYGVEVNGDYAIEPKSMVETIAHEIAHLYVWSHGAEHDAKMAELLEMIKAYEFTKEMALKEEREEPDPDNYQKIQDSMTESFYEFCTGEKAPENWKEIVAEEKERRDSTQPIPELLPTGSRVVPELLPVPSQITPPTPTKPGPSAAEAVGFGICMALAYTAWIAKGAAELLILALQVLYITITPVVLRASERLWKAWLRIYPTIVPTACKTVRIAAKQAAMAVWWLWVVIA